MTNQVSLNSNLNFLGYVSNPEIQINIFNQDDFRDAIEGVPAFFRHTKTLIQYGISGAQKIFHETFHNVTHVGLILNATDREICLAEALGEGVTTKCYSPKDLVQEEICFPLSKQENHSFLKNISKIAREKLQMTLKYDYRGVLQQLFIPKMFTESKKKELIERSADHLLGGELTQSKDAYFCSEFVLESVQMAHLLNYIPDFQKLIGDQLGLMTSTLPQSKPKLIQEVMKYLDVESLWKIVDVNPLFNVPASAISPADLFAMYAQASPVICVSSQDPGISPCNSQLKQDGTECLEYLVIGQLDRHLMGEKVTVGDPGMKELIAELSKKTDYSEKTLSCIFEKFQGDQELSTEIEQCLKDTLSYREQVSIFLLSKALSSGVDRIQEDPTLLDRFLSSNDASVEEAAKEIFPINPFRSKHFLTNIYILLSLKNKDPRFISKNLLLSILYDTSIAKKFAPIGIEKIYPVLENMTNLDRQIFECLYNFCTPNTIIPCSDLCLSSEISAANQIVKNIQQEVDHMIQNPEAWIEDLLEERRSPIKELLSAESNQESLDPQITRTLNPNDPNSYRESLLPLTMLVYYLKNPQADLAKLQNLLSYELASKLIKNKNITNKSVEKIFLNSISKITSINPTALKCIINDCELSLSNKALEDCLDQCVEPILPEHKKKEAIKEQLDSIIQKIEGKELSLFDDENIETTRSLLKSNVFFFNDLPMQGIHNPDLVSKLLELSKKEWDVKPIEEKLALLMRIAYPKTYHTMQLMSKENAQMAVETFRIWNKIHPLV